MAPVAIEAFQVVEPVTEFTVEDKREPVLTRSASSESGTRVFHAAENAIEFFDHLCAHFRETRRTAVEIDCDVRVQLADGSLFDKGAGVIRDVSPSGALLSALKLNNSCLPLEAFTLVLLLKSANYQGICIEATPIRFAAEPGGLGVRFNEIFVTV
jgi:hypothetical protein